MVYMRSLSFGSKMYTQKVVFQEIALPLDFASNYW